jgi:flagellar motor switch protein FliM
MYKEQSRRITLNMVVITSSAVNLTRFGNFTKHIYKPKIWNIIKVRPVGDVFLHEKQETHTRTDGRIKMEIKGTLGKCYIHVRKISQPLIGKTINISNKFNIASTINCW